MAERAARRSARGERHEIHDEVENFQDAVTSMWSSSFPASRFSDLMIGWNEKTGAHLKASRSFASAMSALAERQGKLMLELAQSIEMEAPTDGHMRSASMKFRSDKVDHVFDETADILREAGQLITEAQVNALNLMKPVARRNNPRLVASLEDTEAA